MITGQAARVLLVPALVVACGCAGEPNDPGSATAPGSQSTSATAQPAPQSVSHQPVAGVQPTDEEVAASVAVTNRRLNPSRLQEGPRFRARALSTGDPELDPLVSFLRTSYASEIAAGKELIIEDHVDLHLIYMEMGYQGFIASLIKQTSDPILVEMIRDFGDKNRGDPAVRPELTRHVPAHLLSRAEWATTFTGGPAENWPRFYEKYPGVPGILSISRVGLNREKNRALFYVGWIRGPEDGHGQLHVFEKKGDEWVEQPSQLGASWES